MPHVMIETLAQRNPGASVKAMTSRAKSSELALRPADVWAVISDLSRLPRWNAAIASVSLNGPLAQGVTGNYVPAGLSAPVHSTLAKPFSVSAAIPGERITITQPEPLGAMVIDFHIEPSEVGTKLTQTITMTGPDRVVFWHIIGKRVAAHLTENAAKLYALAVADGVTSLNTVPKTVVIAGGSGALGRQIAADLSCRGHVVRILTRVPQPDLPYQQYAWDGRTLGSWTEAMAAKPGTLAVINLAGKLVDCRPTRANVDALRTSRVDSTEALVAATAELPSPVAHWVQASTTAIWSDMGDVACDEATPVEPGLPQMTGVAQPWEAAAAGVVAEHKVVLRTSIVLDPEAPAFARLAMLANLGLGGRVGNGRQWFSWIHIDDWLAIVRGALGLTPGLTIPDGIVVGAAPHPVRNAELMAALRKHLHRPPSPPTPAAVLKIGAVALRTDPALGLTGRKATSTVLRHSGFEFAFPTLDEALANLVPDR